nr:uncharacterized protein LOC125424086 [Ziziphus jujuba var. spinosa]
MQEYVLGIRMKESKPWKYVNHLLIPLNKRNIHWVVGHVDLKERRMTVYDSDKAGNRYKGQIYFQKLCIMLPYLLRSASFYEQRPDLVDSVDEFTCELAQNTPQQSNG